MPAKNVKPRLRLVDGEWYAFAPNNSAMARALLARAIGWLTSANERRRAVARRAAKAARRKGGEA
jgi:hypothetical protein